MKKLIYGFLLFDVAVFAIMVLTGALGADVNTKAVDFDSAIKANKGILVDVRTPEEFAWERIDGAVNVDWKGNDFEKSMQKFDENEPLLIYCRSGARASRARRKLRKMGFKEILNLDGGILQWKDKGLPTWKSPDYKEGGHGGGEEGC